MNALRYFFFVKKERGASLVLGLAFSVFLAKRSQKNGAKEERLLTLFSPRNDLETFDDGTLSIHTHTHTNIIIMVFTTVLSTVRVVASSVSRHSLSFSILPRFSLSLSLRARMRAVLASRLFTPLFYPLLIKMYYQHTGATTTTTTANQSCLSRVRTADVLSLHEASARPNGDYR